MSDRESSSGEICGLGVLVIFITHFGDHHRIVAHFCIVGISGGVRVIMAVIGNVLSIGIVSS